MRKVLKKIQHWRKLLQEEARIIGLLRTVVTPTYWKWFKNKKESYRKEKSPVLLQVMIQLQNRSKILLSETLLMFFRENLLSSLRKSRGTLILAGKVSPRISWDSKAASRCCSGSPWEAWQLIHNCRSLPLVSSQRHCLLTILLQKRLSSNKRSTSTSTLCMTWPTIL